MTGILFVAWNGALFSMIHIGMIISKRLRTIGAFDFNAIGRGTKTDFWSSDQSFQAAYEGKISDLLT